MKVIKKVFRKIWWLVNQSYYHLFPPNVELLAEKYVSFNEKYNSKKRVLYIALKYDYGDKNRGMSYEEHNFYNTLRNMNHLDVIRFDFYSVVDKYGEIFANKVIEQMLLTEQINVLLCLLYKDCFDHDLISYISESFPVNTVLWVFDDDKRFEETEALSSCFNKIVTTIKLRHKQRLERGENCVLAQFAANHYLYQNYNLTKIYDVIFIGQNFGNREDYIKYLVDNGVNVKTFGMGWPNGRVSQSEMIKLFNQSKIVLNFSSSYGNPHLKYVKGRMFEIPASGAFLLTEACEELDGYFEVGKHLDVFSNKKQLLEKVEFYLKSEDKRMEIAKCGELHVVKNYTFEKYLSEIML